MDWKRMKHEYISGDESIRELAERHGVSRSVLARRASKEKWSAERTKYRDKVVNKSLARACTRDVQKLAGLQRSAVQLAADIERALEDADMPFLHKAAAEGGGLKDEKLRTVNAKNLYALSRALRETTAAMRDLYGISTRAEEHAHKQAVERLAMERERLEIDKAKADVQNGPSEVVVKIDAPAEAYDD